MTDRQVLSEAQWRAQAEAHRRRVEPWIEPRLQRRRDGRRDPVDDFLWEYYRWRPGQLAAWHPGIGITVAGDTPWAGRHPYVRTPHGWTAQLGADDPIRPRLTRNLAILRATADRPARTGCFGMHEWAMVYGLTPDQTRHSYLPLRFAPDEVRRVVDEVGVRCSHYDAFRFFTDQARPLNSFQPTRATQSAFDQPGCLHANMDLYKWAGKLLPAIDSGLLLDTFELARDIRTLDMQASAYDLTSWGYPPVPVETPGGRAAYVSAQRGFSVRAHVLRQRLLQILAILGAERSSADLVDSDGQGRT